MYAYCYNNPVNYADYTGESAVAAAWLAKLGAFAIIEPTMIGEIIFAVAAAGVIIYGAVTVADVVNEASQSDNKKDEAAVPDADNSISDSDTTSETNRDKEKKSDPTSPKNMQKQVERNQAPKEVVRVEQHPGGKPHVHFKDKTSMNNDGTIHDKMHGTPRLTKNIKNG